ncbi:M13 family metallopeptidase [Adhaeribacter radiodurans]|uniref:M13 family metallopeptidase n=1 Tax=Adhaeribacter radiodurans TaxID=2745197 RepID=A0A7L7L844_9BACT|nr:M13 family metallopeptidase [Adhaeribacter radiodurans]QMU28924.1 M13 family metallopeptidase [Adhaeribacter radiodurans]
MTITYYRLGALALTGLYLAGCSTTVPTQQATTTDTAASPATVSTPKMNMGVGLDPANLDTTQSPCADFFQYANGGWIKNNPVPAAERRWGSFEELADKNYAVQRNILTEAAANTSAPKGSNSQKVGDFFGSGMDSTAIEQSGITPLKPYFDKVAAIKDAKGLLTTVAQLKKSGISGMFSFYVGQDDKKSTEYAIFLNQGGLGLPDRDYYLKEDERSKNIRAEYVKHLQNMFTLLGDDATMAQKNATKVMSLETRLAKASRTRVELRDPQANYNKMTIAQLQKQTPATNWNLLLTLMGAKNVNEVIVGQPAFFKELNTLVKTSSLSDWKTYLRWHLIHSTAPYLNQAYVQENFNFYGKVLSGTKALQPRWKRVLRTTDAAIGEAMGQLYVEKTFTPEAKAKALEMVKNLRDAFQEHVQQLDWMSETTKKQALVKLDAFAVKIGYPDKWKDYADLNVGRESYVTNVLQANEFDFNYNVNKLGKPIDRAEWGMTPPTVNAYYNPSMNEIVFPAGIMQPPFFDPKADDAVNYGGMGAVIGHEITHGFDDQGRQYDAEGNLKDWWTKTDADQFTKRADMVVNQYGAYEVLPAVKVNGSLTLGENLADIGGLNIAYTALQKALAGKNKDKIAGFTPEQRFFLAWAQIWRVNGTEQYFNQQVQTDPHSPGRFRTNGPLTNMPQFYEAFGCKPGDKMVKPAGEQIKIW